MLGFPNKYTTILLEPSSTLMLCMEILFQPDFNNSMGFPGGSKVKNPPANAGSISRWRRSPGVEMATHSSILAGKFHGQRSLVGYSPWGRKESDTTNQRSMTISQDNNHIYY